MDKEDIRDEDCALTRQEYVELSRRGRHPQPPNKMWRTGNLRVEEDSNLLIQYDLCLDTGEKITTGKWRLEPAVWATDENHSKQEDEDNGRRG